MRISADVKGAIVTMGERTDNHVYIALALAAAAAILSVPSNPSDLNQRVRALLSAITGPEADVTAGAVGNDAQIFAAPWLSMTTVGTVVSRS
jgi:hypothetical protein